VEGAARKGRRISSRRAPPLQIPLLPSGLEPLDNRDLHVLAAHCGVELAVLDLGAKRLTALSLETAHLNACRPEGAELRRLRYRHVVFEHGDLGGALLMESDLSELQFASCELGGAELFNLE
jgi:uncharacterized protein YjbI with pentapeptide repeats